MNLLNGTGYGSNMSENVKHLFSKLFQIEPHFRYTIDDIKRHPWFNGPVPSEQEIQRFMERRSIIAWKSQHKHQVWEYICFFFNIFANIRIRLQFSY